MLPSKGQIIKGDSTESIHSRSKERRPIIKVRETTFHLELRWFGNKKREKQAVHVKMNIVANRWCWWCRWWWWGGTGGDVMNSQWYETEERS